MLQIKSKFLFVYVLLAGKRTENISYVKNSLLFVHADKGINAEELTTKFLETIQSVGLSVNDMRAQRYDGASVMGTRVVCKCRFVKQIQMLFMSIVDLTS